LPYFEHDEDLPVLVQELPEGERWVYRQVFNQIYRRWRAYGRHDEEASYLEAARQAAEATKILERHPVAGRVTISRTIHRVVPERTSPQAEIWWAQFMELHPGWKFQTWRDPLDPRVFPITSPYWERCENGAQLADLVRMEVLLKYGGFYVDSDVQPLRSFEPLVRLGGVAAWEDAKAVPNAVMGFSAGHPALAAVLDLSLARVPGPTWWSGVGAYTAILPARADVELLSPMTFYPVHYKDPDRERKLAEADAERYPLSFSVHHYAGSWLRRKAS